MAQKFLTNELQELEIRKEEEMVEKLTIISKNLVWLENEVKDSKILVVKKEDKEEVNGQASFDIDGNISDYTDKLSKNGELMDRDASDMVLNGSNRFVVVDDGYGFKVIPTFYTAQIGLLTRRGCNCPGICGNYAIKRPSATVEEAFLNDCASRCKSTEKWGLLDGGAIANVSNSYVPLDALLGYEAFKKELDENWETAFHYGRMSYEYYMADFIIKDEVALDGLKNTLEGLGVKVESLKAYARYSTSDTTNSAMAATIVYELNGTPLQLNHRLGVDHIGEVSIATYRNKIKNLGMLLKEAEDAVEKLGNTDIKHPKNCLENALKKVQLYNKKGRELIDSIQITDELSALDIIIKCNEVLTATAKAEKWSTTQIVDASERVARLLNANFSKLDVQ